jgi:hypothetical protein
MINKNKTYIRRWKCAICGGYVYANYKKPLKKWFLECECGEDTSFSKINKYNFYPL